VEIVSHTDPNILTAAFGLLGVIVGGAITAGTTYLVEERRARREERKEQRKQLIELKRAARLVDEDVKWALAAVVITINEKRWPALLQDPIGLDTWEEYRSLLATETTLSDWRTLQAAVRGMVTYKLTRNKALEQGKWDVNEEQLGTLESKKAALQKARDALKPFLDLAGE
jgi:hypothetical protein